MALVSSVTLSYWRCAFLLLVAFFLLKSPEVILENTYMLLFAHIFNCVVVDTLTQPQNKPLVGIFAILLILNALSDLVAIFLILTLFVKPPILDLSNMKDVKENENAKPRVDNKELYFLYFENLVPLRLALFFLLTGFCYYSDNELVSNNLVCTYGFVEVWFNFVIFNNLRDEKVQRYKKGYFDLAEEEEEVEYIDESEEEDIHDSSE